MLKLKEKNSIYWLVALAFLCGMLFLSSLQSYDLSKRETREALAVYEMVNHGDFFLPKINGDTLRTKPPLFHWMACLFSFAGGKVDEWSARLPSALAATAGVFCVFCFALAVFDRRTALLSAIILATNVKYLEMANKARVDMTLTLFVFLAYLFFYFGYKTRRVVYFQAFFIAMGVASLTKGPLGFLLPFAAIIPFLMVRKEVGFLREIGLGKGAVIILAILCIWLVPALLIGRGELLDIIYQETIARFLGTTTHQGHYEPFYYYLPQILGGLAPWSLFLPLALYWGFKNVKKGDALLFVLIWFVSTFIFFSLSAGKRADYLLPLYPAAALLIGKLWGDFIQGAKEFDLRLYFSISSFPICLVGVVCLAIGLFSLFNFTFSDFSIPSMVKPFMVTEDALAFDQFLALYGTWLPYLFSLICFLGLLAVGHFVGIRKRKGTYAFSLLVAMCLSLAVAGRLILPQVNKMVSLKPFADAIKKQVPEEAELYFYDRVRLKLVFYSERHIPLISHPNFSDYFGPEKTTYLITPESYLEEVKKRSGVPMFTVASFKNFKSSYLLLSNKNQ